MTMTVDVGSDLNGSITDLSALKPSAATTTSNTNNVSYTAPSVEKNNNFHESSHTQQTVECSESSWLGDNECFGSPLTRASAKERIFKKPLGNNHNSLKCLLEVPDLDGDDDDNNQDLTSVTHDEDDDVSIKEILEAYLASQKAAVGPVSDTDNNDESFPVRKPSSVGIPAQRPKLYRTPTPDPDGLYLEIRKSPRRYRKCSAEQRQAISIIQGAIRDWLTRRHRQDVKREETSSDDGDESSDDNLRFVLCRNKSFEGIMGEFLKRATPKKSVPRRQEESPMEPNRGTVGASKSFDEHDFAQALGISDVRRGGRRPRR